MSNVKRVSPADGKQYFFGYYDVCPWNKEGTHLLMHGTNAPLDRLPEKRDVAYITLIDAHTLDSKDIAETTAWNWQVGSRLQWIGGSNRVIFNDRRDGKLVARICDTEGKEMQVLDSPFTAVHPVGNYALSVDFSRIQEMRRGYGYDGAEREEGIMRINLASGEKQCIVPFTVLGEGKQWVNFVTFNPNGTRFAFLHRTMREGGRMYERLVTANTDGSDMRILLDTGMASHFAWKNDETIIVWGRRPGIVSRMEKRRRLLKLMVPVYHRIKGKLGAVRRSILQDGYLEIADAPGAPLRDVGRDILTENGHGTVSPDEKWFLTDTYAGKTHERELFLYRLADGYVSEIGKFYSLPDKQYTKNEHWDDSAMRCDLHPRWNRSGTEVCIDSVHEGMRGVYVLDVGDIIRT